MLSSYSESQWTTRYSQNYRTSSSEESSCSHEEPPFPLPARIELSTPIHSQHESKRRLFATARAGVRARPHSTLIIPANAINPAESCLSFLFPLYAMA